MNTDKTFWIGVGGLVCVLVLAIGYVALSTPRGEEQVGVPQSISAQDHIQGSATSSIVLISYSDFQCPACAAFEPAVVKILDTYGSDIVFVYRYFSLETMHKNALSAAVSAEAAGKQGKFWDMHKLLFERQKDWEKSLDAKNVFAGYAEEIGLDMQAYASAVEDSALVERVRADFKEGSAIGVAGTPTFFLNGKKLQLSSISDLETVVAEAVNSSKQ